MSEEIQYLCSKCKKLYKCTTNCINSSGSNTPKMLFVGESPDLSEDEIGETFTGRPGKFIRRNLMRATEINEEDVRYTYTIRCCPPKGKKATLSDIYNCRNYLKTEVETFKPKVLVCFGNHALASVLSLNSIAGIQKWRGKPIWHREFNCWVVATYHPNLIFVDKGKNLNFKYNQSIADLELAMSCINRPIIEIEMPKSYFITDETKLDKYLDLVVKCNSVAVDTETDGLDPRNDILGVSLCIKLKKKYLPVYFTWELLIKNLDIFNKFKNILVSTVILKIFQNYGFDVAMFYWHGLKVKGSIKDTMIALHLLDENFPCGLKENTWRYLSYGGYEKDLDAYKRENKFTKKTSYKKIPVEILSSYAAIDALATYQLDEILEAPLKEQELWYLYNKNNLPAREVLSEMSINGFTVDIEKSKIVDEKCESFKLSLIQKIYEIAGKKFNINSKKQLRDILFNKLNLKSEKFTKKTKSPSTDNGALKLIAQQDNKNAIIVQYLLDYSYLKKMQSTYLKPPIKNIWKDGKVHSSFNMTGTKTGRSSNSNPCNANIPRDGLIRSIYTASKGNLLLEADIKGAELRAVGMASGEFIFLDAFEKGLDLHTHTASIIFEVDYNEVTKEQRQHAKIINFAIIYGITKFGLSKQLKCSLEEAEKFIKMYFKKLPKLYTYLQNNVKLARKYGYVKTAFKRRRRLEEINTDDKFLKERLERMAKNAPIQGAIADFTNKVTVDVFKTLELNNLKSVLIHSIYDCIIIDTVPEELEQIKDIVKKAFEAPIKEFSIKMEVDIHVINVWGEGNESKLQKLFDSLTI